MSQNDIRRELEQAEHEPLLPVEKKLIAWSLGTGLVLLVVLALVNQLFPATF
jgi:putative exporter of polyketide antibiotics